MLFEPLRNQRPQDINSILNLIDTEYARYYSELEQYGIPRSMIRRIFEIAVSYAMRNQEYYSGTAEQKTSLIMNNFRIDSVGSFSTLRGFGVPNSRIDKIISDIIRFTLISLTSPP